MVVCVTHHWSDGNRLLTSEVLPEGARAPAAPEPPSNHPIAWGQRHLNRNEKEEHAGV